MKVYFTASLRGTQFYESFYTQIFHAIESLGHQHLDREIFTLNRIRYYSELDTIGRKANVELYRRKIKAVQSADICVFEVSLHSLSIGFQIEKALQYLKPTIVLYADDNLPYFLDGIQDDKLILSSYSQDTILETVTRCIELAKQKREQRFNFFLTPDLMAYLEESAKKSGVNKSTYLRSLIARDRTR